MQVLVTGATGYIGGRLVPELLAAGHDVRCLARTPAKLADRPWRGDVQVVRGDVGDAADLATAMEGTDAAYYLVHSMGGAHDFERRDRMLAATFRDAAAGAGVGQIVYLGGLGHDDEDLSPHLRSRHEVGRVLADGPVTVTELRAAVIIGSGSASFEMLRHLVEVLPAMVTPRWVDTRCQPIAIRDILHHLVAVITTPDAQGEVLEVGGADVLTYREMMQTYARVAGLRPRLIVPVPVLTPRLSSLWVGLVTPMPTGLARPLIDSLVSEVVVADRRAEVVLPHQPLRFEEACRLALRRVEDLEVATWWAGAESGHGPVAPWPEDPAPPGAEPGDRPAGWSGDPAPPAAEQDNGPADPWPEDPGWAGGTVYTDRRVARSSATPEQLFAEIARIGGAHGYPAGGLLWGLRGVLDALVGGVGLRRGRRHPEEVRVGDPIDFWRVESVEPARLLRLRAEMRLPGEAWLEFRVEPDGAGSRLIQRARFHPRGLWGRLYWAVVSPFHGLIFPRMAARLATRASVNGGRAPTR